MQEVSRRKVVNRTNRIAGQVSGIKTMIESDRYCLDILDQIASVQSALDGLSVELLANHLQSCLLRADDESQDAHDKAVAQAKMVEEIRASMKKLVK